MLGETITKHCKPVIYNFYKKPAGKNKYCKKAGRFKSCG
ncbi:vasoactive intestinal polypeptide receptor 2 [Acetobacter orientalis]|uniref:Vasoactive intestinal polypeptide receptor 2 n=1 Tax=Acetobacter orientalis TaxID=146474 RepID=A0A2Z5ZGQ7_9PROT|nr:vasoactive intestinal polypeptide receptor 2 [Acetobacter orientalis]